eukprot:TRINITY_DN13573_c0_g1_i1.p1 TRINITY_DN13573_c0_g1~~TRINITY_DN13573_c0_g1_i1.p1  ORF type:complete len:353 (-),score=42.60 TRINITY_DN13573_c0_g1_i1:277-1335(-)
MSPPFVLRVSCLSLEATRSAVAFPLTVQAELYDDRGQLIANEVDSESGMRPVTRNTIGLPLEAFTSTGGSGSGPVSFGRAGHEATVSFERLRINKTNRGKANFLQFLVFAHASDGSGQVVLLAQSDAVRVVVSSNSDHHRDIAAREVWLALGGVTAKPRESLPAPQVLLWVSENLYSHTGRGLSEWEKKKFADALATCGGMCSFEWFRDVLWRQLHEAEKSLRRTPTLLSMWQANLVYGFASREESVAQLAGEGAREGDCLVRFSDSKAGSGSETFFGGSCMKQRRAYGAHPRCCRCGRQIWSMDLLLGKRVWPSLRARVHEKGTALCGFPTLKRDALSCQCFAMGKLLNIF